MLPTYSMFQWINSTRCVFPPQLWRHICASILNVQWEILSTAKYILQAHKLYFEDKWYASKIRKKLICVRKQKSSILCSINLFACLLLSILMCNDMPSRSVLLICLVCWQIAAHSLTLSLSLPQPLHSVHAQNLPALLLNLAQRYKCATKSTNRRIEEGTLWLTVSSQITTLLDMTTKPYGRDRFKLRNRQQYARASAELGISSFVISHYCLRCLCRNHIFRCDSIWIVCNFKWKHVDVKSC